MELESFADVKAAMSKNATRPFHLLLGNGFSMSYDPGIFSYNALHDFVSKVDNDLLQHLFRIVDTRDFEVVLKQLETFAALGEAFGINQDLKQSIERAAADLKRSLIDAIRALHPEHVFTVPQQKCDACSGFLKQFLDSNGSIFTTNYDLLLYWILMRSGLGSIDGFGRDREGADEYVKAEDVQYSELRWGKNKEGQNVFYVHGALPLFDTGIDIVKEEYNNEHFLLDQITRRVDAGEYPVFVTAGDGLQKLAHIRHNRYLEHSYENLAAIQGSIVTFGFNFGEQDSHIVRAINAAAKNGQRVPERLWSIYIGVFSEKDQDRIEAIATRFKCKVHIFDSKTAPVWS